ncbi:endonuclease MutS2 [Atribacter laminatus]|uniref:Endonuclease MutS2 n=1 Tax=Atribacter laminatus TaxID=2847778 RepID=A0A7T1ANN1_ATRLM|nr:endonuclease MutS2 [Atribacter laminatus]QPM69252.1 Endonuclease MutS2 [Atribacter laminatus]
MMNLSKDILKNFDFDKILDQLSSACVCEVSREKMMELHPYTNPEAMNQRLQTVQQLFDFITFDGSLDLSGLSDLREIFQKIAIPGSVLSLYQVILLFNFLLLCEKTKRLQKATRIDEKYPLLTVFFNDIESYTSLIKKIKLICSPEGFILDSASPRLRDIRRRLNHLQAEVRTTIEKCLHNRDIAPFLQDATYTIRRGRYVIPIKSEFRGRIDGIVADYSSSGSSVFIEPKPILYLNNELEVLTIQEKDEIDTILLKLANDLRPYLSQLESSFQAMLELDILHAQSQLARKWRAHIPRVGEKDLIIKEGRHPLLGEKAVPFSLQISSDKKTMVISGPNAGGKTVLLKSLALIVYLAHCGIPVPVNPGSSLPFYHHLFVDIGDHQDIEQNLSTFTYRLSAFQESLTQLSSESLYLIDEIGAGTDPNEGSALAIGMIDFLGQQGATCIATTHYPLIKSYVSQHPAMISASMEFNPILFQPTYRLLVDEIGESYGIKIAENIGIPQPVIKIALQQLQKEWIDLNELIISNRKKNQELNIQLLEWQEKVKDATNRQREVVQLQEQLESQKKILIKDFQEKLTQYLKKTRDDISQLIGQLRKEKTLDESVYQELKERVDPKFYLTQELTWSPSEETIKDSPQAVFQAGEKVMVDIFQQEGEIISIDDLKNEATVVVNGRKCVLSINHLQKKSKEEEFSSSLQRSYSFQPSLNNVRNQIEIRMMKAEDAREKLDKYFDQVLLAGFKTVYIIHGKGEGILRKVTHEFLQDNPAVESYRNGLPEEGGLGVTVVILKD